MWFEGRRPLWISGDAPALEFVTKREKERLSSRDKVHWHCYLLWKLPFEYIIYFKVNTLPRPLTWAEQTFSIHPYTSQTKPLLGEVDRGSEKDLGVVGSIQKWEMLSFMQMRRKNASQKCRLWVSQGAGVLHGIKQKSLNHIVCIFHLDFICNCD